MAETNPYAAPAGTTDAVVGGDESLTAIAQAQRHLLLGVLVSMLIIPLGMIGAAPLGEHGAVAITVLFWSVYIGRAVLAYRLARVLDSEPIVWGIGAIIPSCIGLIVLLVLNQRATSRLTSGGWKVGLMGARPPQ